MAEQSVQKRLERFGVKQNEHENVHHRKLCTTLIQAGTPMI